MIAISVNFAAGTETDPVKCRYACIAGGVSLRVSHLSALQCSVSVIAVGGCLS